MAAFLSIILEVSTADAKHRSSAWIEGFAILMAVMISAFVTAINDYQKEREFQNLNCVADEKKQVTLKRDDILINMHQDFVLAGDIVNIETGMEVPADGILLEASDITTDESAMTGEIDPIKKSLLKDCIARQQEIEANGEKNLADRHEVPSPIVMSGTKILSGEGRMLILVVGDESCIGRVRVKLDQDEVEPTPLQAKL